MENTPMDAAGSVPVRLESRAPSLLEAELAEYCRLRASLQQFQASLQAHVLGRPRLAAFLAALEGTGDWEQAARDIGESLVAVPITSGHDAPFGLG